MKNPFLLSSEKAWKGGLIAISYFLLAACMQHEESVSPRNHDALTEKITAQSNDVSAWMKKTFTTHLKSENELADVVSQAQGQVIFHVSDDGNSIAYKLIVANINNITAAHIHCGDPTQNGPFVVFLFSGGRAGLVNGVLAEGTITEEDILTPTRLCTDLDTMEELLALFRSGTAYVNVHTNAYPGGEIRGQIK